MFMYKGIGLVNESEKMKTIGIPEYEYITRQEDIYLFLAHYLGCITIEQLVELTIKLKPTIRVAMSRLEKEKLIACDYIDKQVYYRCTKKGILHIQTYGKLRKPVKIKKRKHLEKINDFYLHLLRRNYSYVSIDHEVKCQYGDYKNLSGVSKDEEIDSLYIHDFIADAQIKLGCEDYKCKIILEQDNGTERINILREKISKYFNFILHQEVKQSEIEIYVFRTDIVTSSFQLKKFNTKLNLILEDNYNQVKRTANLYRNVKNSSDPEVYFDEAKDLLATPDISKQAFLNNISSTKAQQELVIRLIKTFQYSNFKSSLNASRLKSIKSLFEGEVAIDKFYDTSKNSVFYDITGDTQYSNVNSKIDIDSIMLKVNFACGDNEIEHYLNYYNLTIMDHFKEYVRLYLKDIGLEMDINKVIRTQKRIKFGYETIKFDFATNVRNGNEDIDFILLLPNTFISDLIKIRYIAYLDSHLINLDKHTVFFIIEDEDTLEPASILLESRKLSNVKVYIKRINDISITSWSILGA